MKKEIESIRERNIRVETDKAWETSFTRRGIIAILTYMVIGLFLTSIKVSNPWLNALVPSVGFILSTLILSPIKNYWVKNIYKR
jgi:hypothetical protein